MAHAWTKRPCAGRFWRVANLTARIVEARHPHPHKSKRIKGDRHDRSKTQKVPQFCSDHPFPYVLVCSTFGTIVSLAAIRIVTAHSVAQAMVA
jgi:hypothetical protein